MSITCSKDSRCLKWLGCGFGSLICTPLFDEVVYIGTDGSKCKQLQKRDPPTLRLPNPELPKVSASSPENSSALNKCAHVPFGIGPRNYVGTRLARLQLKYTVAGLVQQHRLELEASQELMPLIVDLTLSSLELPTFPDLPCLQAYDVTWNTQWDQPSGTTPEASRSVDIKPSPSPPDFSGGGSTLATMSLTHAWLSLQLMPLIVDLTLSSLELPTFPDLPCLQAYDVTWNTQWDQPRGTTPEASHSVDIKPSPSPPDFSGGGSTLATMSLTHAWLSLQLMPLIVDLTLSSLELPTFSDLPCLQAYDVTWNTQWDQPNGTTPEASRSVDIKPSPSPPDFSGGGSTLATMSLTHAWLSLQLMPLIVDLTLSSLELPTFPDLPCLQAYDVTWNTQWDQPRGTTPEASHSVDIKPSPSPPDFSGGGSTLATMSLTHAWLSLQLMPLIVDLTLSSLKLPTFPDLPCLQAYDVTWNTQWDQPSGTTPEASRSGTVDMEECCFLSAPLRGPWIVFYKS
ncbi:hypothetical protein MRX96_047514 [Rhipicephalus microplus]